MNKLLALFLITLLVIVAGGYSPASAQNSEDCTVLNLSYELVTVPNGTLNANTGLICENGEWVAVGKTSTAAPADDEADEAPAKPSQQTSTGEWEIEWFSGATDQMRGLGSNPWPTFEPAYPAGWPDFPNVDNTTMGFDSAQGLEYGMAESAYCQQDSTCDVNTPAMHYRIISGDYNIPGVDQCSVDENGEGCAIMLINVGTVTAMFRDSTVDYGFTVFGRYWDGDELPVAIVAGLSHTANNMLNYESMLNDGTVNAGANCSVPGGCDSVRLTFVVLSGNEVLIKGVTHVTAKTSSQSSLDGNQSTSTTPRITRTRSSLQQGLGRKASKK